MAWVLWSDEWRPMQPGAYVSVVRATVGTGTLQTAMGRSFAPEDATGYHDIMVRFDAEVLCARISPPLEPSAIDREGWGAARPRSASIEGG
jgi:hypothetical protein